MDDIFLNDKVAFGVVDASHGMLDMRFGDPAFLQPYWQGFRPEIITGYGLDMGYANTYGSDSLRQAVRDIHEKVGNAVTKDRYIVFGVGASQLVAAAIYALGNKEVYVQGTYFSRFAQFAKFSGIDATLTNIKSNKYQQTEIVTCPNNPDGRLDNEPKSSDVIHDLVYNWPQYTDVVSYDEDIMIFGLAKATGHASTRVGWALVKDDYIADHMQHYIEMNTCGVGVESLKMCERILRQQIIVENDATVFKHGKDKLRRRKEKLREALKDDKVKILSDNGMFLWGVVNSENSDQYFANKYGILVVNGSYFGITDNNHFRINLGVNAETFSSLIKKLSV